MAGASVTPRAAATPRVVAGGPFALVIVQALLLLAVWVHLWVQHSTCCRYVFPMVLMGSGLAGLGLLRLSAMVGQWVGQWVGPWTGRGKGTVAFPLGENRDQPVADGTESFTRRRWS